MSLQWARIQYLSTDAQRRIYNMYEEHELPLDVRVNLAVWIENNILNDNNAGVGNGDENMRITMLCSELIEEIRRNADLVGNSNMDFSQFKLHRIAENLQNLQPIDLYRRFKACLNYEKQVLYEHTNAMSPEGGESSQYEDTTERDNVRKSANFSHRICTLTNNRVQCVYLVDTMHSVVNELKFALGVKENTIERSRLQLMGNQQPSPSNINGLSFGHNYQFETNVQRELQKVDQEIATLNTKLQKLQDTAINLAQLMVTELTSLVQTFMDDYMTRLKWSEITSEEHGLSLDGIQSWHSELLETTVQLRRLRTSYLQQILPAILNQLMQQLNPLFFSLMSNSLVVQEQPSQVVKKDTKFNTSVRFLSGEKFISPQGSPVVKVSVVNEHYAAILYQEKSPSHVTYNGHGKIINNLGNRLTENDTRSSQRLIMQFRNVAISTVRRGEKNEKSQKSTNRAMTEKFCLVYTSHIDIDGQSCEVWCCSVPFVFIVHVSQKCEATGNIFWDRSFCESGRTPFVIPQEVTWAKMAPALRKCFKTMTGTTWNLTESNLKYIGGKIFKTTDFNDTFIISRKKFCEKESTSKIGHWEWFYSIIELTIKHLGPFWEKGIIIGFMYRCYAERSILANWGAGTFMLRFSDSTLGGISISYAVGVDHGRLEIRSLAPFTDNDLKVRSLSDRIHDADQFVNVYYHGSNGEQRLTAKAQAFPRQNERSSLYGAPGGKLVRSSYVQAEVVMVIASSTNNGQVSSSAPSPMPQQQPQEQSGRGEMPSSRLSGDSLSDQSPLGQLNIQNIEIDDDGLVDFIDGLAQGLDPEMVQDIFEGFETLSMPPTSPELHAYL